MLINGHGTRAAHPADPSWQTRALCAQMDPELWFPEPWEDEAPAKAACRRCPLRAACLAYALDSNEEHGIWGGLSPDERHQIRSSGDADLLIAAESEAA